MAKHPKAPKVEKPAKQPKPDPAHPDRFPGSSFAPLVPDGPSTDVPGYVTEPNERGACRRTLVEDYLNDRTEFPHGPPADACRLWITDGVKVAFALVPGIYEWVSVDYNCGKANLFAGLGYGADPSTPQICDLVESRGRLHLSDTLAFRGVGNDGTPAYEITQATIDAWKADKAKGGLGYVRTPFAVATDPPEQLGGGL